MSKTTWTALAALTFGLGLGACASKKGDTAPPDGGAACTEEAKVCADGSSVARTGPDCEFPACPEDAADGGDLDEDLDDEDEDAEPASDEEAPAEEAAADGE